MKEFDCIMSEQLDNPSSVQSNDDGDKIDLLEFF